MIPVPIKSLELVFRLLRKYDVSIDPSPEALFLQHLTGFTVWALPDNKPEGWPSSSMTFSKAWNKPAAYIADVVWVIKDGTLTALELETDAEELRVHSRRPPRIFNRPEDVRWTKSKVRWLFEKAGVPLPKIILKKIPGE
jgi:hypothetical protein